MDGKKRIIRAFGRARQTPTSLFSRVGSGGFFFTTKQLSGDCQLIGTEHNNNPFAPDERIARRGFFFLQEFALKTVDELTMKRARDRGTIIYEPDSRLDRK